MSLGVLITSTTPLVLIAERDENVRALQQVFLERAGFSVEFANDGLSAYALVRSARPVVLVTEILLPKLDGLSLCRRLRDDPDTAHLPVIVFSILTAAARATEAGARAFLRKPIVESTFVETVSAALTSHTPAPATEPQWAAH